MRRSKGKQEGVGTIGRRIIFLKRPAVLYAALFAAGIAAERLRPCVVMGAFLVFYTAGFWMLGRLRKGKRKVSSGDRLLFAAPVCFLFGFLLMCGRRMEYNNQALQLEKSMGDGREILARGTVTHIRETKNGFAFELKQAETGPDSPEGEYQKAGTLLVYTDSLAAENGTIKDGQQVLLHGKGRGTKAAGTPGEFDAAQYYFSLGITGTLSADTMRITNFSYHRLNQAFFLAKNKLMERYPAYLGEEDAGVVSSMLLGERALLSEDTKELYRRGGISHILAISGVKMLSLVSPYPLKKPVNWAFMRLHIAESYIISEGFSRRISSHCPSWDRGDKSLENNLAKVSIISQKLYCSAKEK